MTNQPASAVTTILFTDLVNSTELLQRAGDEQAQSIFQAHHRLLREAVPPTAAEVKWLGDGLMVAFPSAADAVRCAIAMQQASRRAGSGERLGVRAGSTSAKRSATRATTSARRSWSQSDSATSARRRADPLQQLVAWLLAGRQAFAFRDSATLELKGITTPVAAREVSLRTRGRRRLPRPRRSLAARTRWHAFARSSTKRGPGGAGSSCWSASRASARRARPRSSPSTRGRRARWCSGGAATRASGRPVRPVRRGDRGLRRRRPGRRSRADLGSGAPPIARLVPAIRERLPDIDEPAPLQPDEERFRLLDAVSQFLIAASQRAPVVLVLDDLHWADRARSPCCATSRASRAAAAAHAGRVPRRRARPPAPAGGSAGRASPRGRVRAHRAQGARRRRGRRAAHRIAEQEVTPRLRAGDQRRDGRQPVLHPRSAAAPVEEGKLSARTGAGRAKPRRSPNWASRKACGR